MIRGGYRMRRMDLSTRGTLDGGLGLVVAIAGSWALILAAITIIGVQQ